MFLYIAPPTNWQKYNYAVALDDRKHERGWSRRPVCLFDSIARRWIDQYVRCYTLLWSTIRRLVFVDRTRNRVCTTEFLMSRGTSYYLLAVGYLFSFCTTVGVAASATAPVIQLFPTSFGNVSTVTFVLGWMNSEEAFRGNKFRSRSRNFGCPTR